jgi:hypothetical protein
MFVCRSLSKVRAGSCGNHSGSGYQARRWQCETLRVYRAVVCVCCVRRGKRRLGGVVRGRLRRPFRPLQVIGVLAAVLPIARKSLSFSRSAERAGKLPIPAQINLAKSGERLHANMAHPVGRSECELMFKSAAKGQLSYEFVMLQPTKSTTGGSRRILCAIGA